MRAALVDRYGPPEAVEIRDVPTPVPGEDEILVRIRATTVNSGDARVRAARVPRGMGLMIRIGVGFFGPRQKVLGFEGAGEVEAVGAKVTAFEPGDRVLASHGFKFGLHAEYATFTENDAIVRIPDGLSYEQAVAIPFGGATAKWFFEAAKLEAGERVLINGASGAVGVIAVQLAKHMGAEVTGVCSAKNADLVRSLGADHVVAHDREDFMQSGKTYDLIMDTHGNAPLAKVKHMLAPGGRFLMVIGDLFQMLSGRANKQVIGAGDENENAVNKEAYTYLLDLAARGVIRPVIDSTYSFEQMVEAHRRVDGGHKVGSVVVTLG